MSTNLTYWSGLSQNLIIKIQLYLNIWIGGKVHKTCRKDRVSCDGFRILLKCFAFQMRNSNKWATNGVKVSAKVQPAQLTSPLLRKSRKTLKSVTKSAHTVQTPKMRNMTMTRAWRFFFSEFTSRTINTKLKHFNVAIVLFISMIITIIQFFLVLHTNISCVR